MTKPKTIKGFLKLLILVADSSYGDFKDFDKLTEKECHQLNTTIAGLQNDLGEDLQALLNKYKLQWNG